MSWLDVARVIIAVDEGSGPVRNGRSLVYYDIKNIPSIGIGRNLRDRGLSALEVAYLFDNDLADVERECRETVPSFEQLSDVRKAVIANMCFNLGEGGLQEFHQFLAAIAAQDWKKAASSILNSRAAQQLPKRYARLSSMMENNVQWTGPT